MRAILVLTFVYGVFCDQSPVQVQKISVERNQKNDLDSAASGYIYRSDGNNPPIYIKLGNENIERYDGALKNAGLNLPAPKEQHYRKEKPYQKEPTFPILKSKTKPFNPEASDIFKEAFKNIPSMKELENEHDFPILGPNKYKSAEELEDFDIKNIPEIPEERDDYQTPEIDAPNSVTHFESEEHEESPYLENDKYAYPKKAYVAPVYEVPNPDDVSFNPHKPPVKYELKPKKPKTFSTRMVYDKPSEHIASGENYEGEDLNEYTSRHTHADYHHKPKKQKYAKGSGHSFKEDHHSSHGEKGDKGYKKYHEFDEGEMGHHGKEGKKGFYEDEMGYKKSHHDEGDKFGEHHGDVHKEKGVKYGESGGHKKGHKTTGYHNIFHKDEYKKEHKFYDDAHKHGYHDKHGGYHQHHGKKHGHKASGGFHNSDFDHGHKGSSGHYKKGHFDQDHKGHKGKAGHESHYSHHDDYGKKGGHSESEKHGFHHGH